MISWVRLVLPVIWCQGRHVGLGRARCGENVWARALEDRTNALALRSRRELVFAGSVTLAGLATTFLCLMPLFFADRQPLSLFPDALQEGFFFDLIGWVGGCWLLSFISAVCGLKGMSRVGQWLGIILLCTDQVILMGIWHSMSVYQNEGFSANWLAPAILELFFIGYFFGFFTMPALTWLGSRRLTGLGTLAVLLPWLLAREAIILGTQYLCGAS